jgi:Tfp pilus assembly protein PilF
MNAAERMAKLEEMLRRQPDDIFLLYALAMEHKVANNAPEALRWIERILAKDPGYVPAYQQAGQIHEATGDVVAAARAYRQGIEAAARKGDHHAQEEMTAALEMLG